MYYNSEVKKRAKSQCDKILDKLRDAGCEGITNVDMSSITLNHTARMAEMRKRGYKFEVTDDGYGVFTYKLISEPQIKMEQEKAIDIFWREIQGSSLDEEELKEIIDRNGFNVVRKWGCNL